MDEDDIYFRELCMLTGAVNKDINYLYYLLVKDGVLFDDNTEESEVIQDECTVDTFDSWFENL